MSDPFQRLTSNMTSSGLLPVPNDSSASNRPRNRRAGTSQQPGGEAASTSTSLLSAGTGSSSPSRRASPNPSLRARSGHGHDATLGVGGGRAGGSGLSPGRSTFGSGAHKKSSIWDTSSWTTPSWASVTEFASSLLSGEGSVYGSDTERSRGGSRNGSRSRKPRPRTQQQQQQQPGSSSWGPEPRPKLADVAAGSLAEREAALKARRTASVLESHDGVNGGLDVAGRFKRRSSDEDLAGSFSAALGSGPGSATGGASAATSQGQQEPEEQLVYLHHVKSSDTYAGIVLKYRCREDVFRKANGLWSRDSVQTRKLLTIPVDACEIKGRPCDPPSDYLAPKVDLLAATPGDGWGGASGSSTGDGIYGGGANNNNTAQQDDFFAPRSSSNGRAPGQAQAQTQIQQPSGPGEDAKDQFTHVRWVALESFAEPVEIARVSRRSMGYFPPRRKKSLGHHTVSSSLSTPRGSFDVPGSIPETAAASQESPGGSAASTSSSRGGRRHSLLSTATRPQVAHAYSGTSTPPPTTTRSTRVGSIGAATSTTSGGDDSNNDFSTRPAWMRRPGGVGSMGRNVRAPGPEKDYFNSFTKRHFPGFNLDSLPSMSVMGSETARFGFGSSSLSSAADRDPAAVGGAASAGIVESPFEDGRDAYPSSASAMAARQGTGLDKAAAAVETWLRGAFVKRGPGYFGHGGLGGGGGSGGGGGGGHHHHHHHHHHSHGPSRLLQDDLLGDLIELEDTNSEDGRGGGVAAAAASPYGGSSSLAGAIAAEPPTRSSMSFLSGGAGVGASGRSDGSSALRGRGSATSMPKGGKSD